MYITYSEYTESFEMIDEMSFKNLSIEACRVMDIHTTGIDNVKKLQKYFPTDEYSARAVRHCAAKIVNFLNQIRDAEMTAAAERGYTETAQGLQRRIISRIEAGNEAISYSEAKTDATYIDAAVADKAVRDKIVAEIIWENLSGVEDANGVNLLFMGRYPGRY
jgi:hypothetical protein